MLGCIAMAAVPAVQLGRGKPSGCIDMDRVSYLPQADAIEFMQRERLRGRLITFFDWGEYAIWHLHPALRVSMDGRRETVYSQAQIDSHLRLYANVSTDAELRALSADYAWLPTALPVVGRLEAQGWRRLHEDRTSVVLARDGTVTTAATSATPSRGGRCFPGP